MTETTIRAATAQDAEGIAAVHVRAWQWAYRGLMPADFLDELDPAKRTAMWIRLMNDDISPPPFVAVDGQRVIGFCHAAESRDGDASPAVGEVTAIYLHPDYVGTGVGRRLWSAAIEHLGTQGFSEVTVWVLDTNTRGRSFYERVGLTLDGATKTDELRGFPVTELRYRGTIPTS